MKPYRWLAPLVLFLPLTVTVEAAATVVGTWYVSVNGSGLQNSPDRAVLVVSQPEPEALLGTWTWANRTIVAEHLSFDANASRLRFCVVSADGALEQWFIGTVAEGVAAGRYSEERPAQQGSPCAASAVPPASYLSYQWLFSGWNANILQEGRGIFPRSYHVQFYQKSARLRIDQDPKTGAVVARWKVYYDDAMAAKTATLLKQNATNGARLVRVNGKLGWVNGTLGTGEQLEVDARVDVWDGSSLNFTVRVPNDDGTDSGQWLRFFGTIAGHTAAGTLEDSQSPGNQVRWTAWQSAVLGFGLVERDDADRLEWQRLTARRLQLLLMNGNPPPASPPTVTIERVPLSGTALGSDRDDNAAQWPQTYDLFNVTLEYAVPLPYPGLAPIPRRVHGFFARPHNGTKAPAALVLNGHRGSAWQALYSPDGCIYWHGDALARRGFAVMAVDVSHRPPNETVFYSEDNGDDPAHGNGAHPGVFAPGHYYSDFEEDGERVWDAMRGLDYLLSQEGVDTNRVLVTGLSMGGEITSFTGALDPRVAVVSPAGYSPDLDVVYYHGNHPCWKWLRSNVREYIDASDLHALIAPRPLIVHTGRQDSTYSNFSPPFAGDKQVLRLSRAAYGQASSSVVHYLHYDAHRWHAGDVDPVHPNAERWLRTPALVGPSGPNDMTWQIDGNTTLPFGNVTLFDVLHRLWS